MKKSIISALLIFAALSCADGYKDAAMPDIDNIITITDKYLDDVNNKRALANTTDDDKSLVLYNVTELRRTLVRFKSETDSTGMLTALFNGRKNLLSIPLTMSDRGAMSPLLNAVRSLILQYQTDMNTVVGIYEQEFFIDGIGLWSQYSISGSDQYWYATSFSGKPYMYISAYAGGSTYNNEDWLISQEFQLGSFSGITISFDSAAYNTNQELTIWYSYNYDGTGNPNSSSYRWTQLPLAATDLSTGSYLWTGSPTLSIPANGNSKVRFAFRYLHSGSNSNTYELTNVLIQNIP